MPSVATARGHRQSASAVCYSSAHKRRIRLMIIKVEPRDWNMASVFLLFDTEEPNPEDERVRTYLDECGLVPKRTTRTQVEDREREVWSFGSCYLGLHLQAIAEIQRKVLEREVLTIEVHTLLKEGPNSAARDRAAGIGEEQLWAAVEGLLDEYHRDSSFATDDDGRISVALDAAEVQQSFLRVVSSDTRG